MSYTVKGNSLLDGRKVVALFRKREIARHTAEVLTRGKRGK